MKKFINAMREFKKIDSKQNPKLVYNKNALLGNEWLVTILFSENFIKSKGLEVCN